ncbi:MAG TPA: glucose-6-phosphate dehydrogenase assembly protein OpcA [Chthoniobacterales bacterium]|nr:glucose-6-phosphate dehydrogenase assembly protein OpcA [Chthoniobacterales bacterium]
MASETNIATAAVGTGLPVEIGKIARELKKLWEQGGEAMSRASLINLAVYSEAPGALERNTQLVSAITEDHACRAVVISANAEASEDHVEAWIAAHCHVSRAGSKQICSEQISFALSGSLAKLLPNILFSHLDSDLPLYLWWQEEFPEPMDPELWRWVDRLIYDSQSWSDFDAQMRLVEQANESANERMVLCDLNWTRLVHLRLALAQFFDPPLGHNQLANIQRVKISFAPDYRSTALLLLGWFAAQLGWTLVEAADEATLGFADCAGDAIRVLLDESAGEPISRCSVSCGETEFHVSHAVGADLLEVTAQLDGSARMHQLMPAAGNDAVALMREELSRGGPHRVYLRAVNVVRELL